MKFPTFRLDGKVAMVTGATKGIGRAIALALGNAGADVVVVSRNQDECTRVACEIQDRGSLALAVQADVTRSEDIERLFEETLEKCGKIDILVNNAGTSITKSADKLTEEDYDQVLRLDERAVFFMAQAAGRRMITQGGGRIINVASVLGLIGAKLVLPYCVAKGGVIQMTRALALEWARHNIIVNCVCPGYVMTAMNENHLKDEKIHKAIVGKIPLGRLGEVEDMVGSIIFLASDASCYVTGQCLVVDGGWTAQ